MKGDINRSISFTRRSASRSASGYGHGWDNNCTSTNCSAQFYESIEVRKDQVSICSVPSLSVLQLKESGCRFAPSRMINQNWMEQSEKGN